MTSSRPLVSILINNHNYGRFLRDAIDSALNQTYPSTEVIVVDDGSTDDSREIIRSYGDRIIPVLKENGGHASAFNAGFAASKGSLICYLDSDDVWLPTKAERVVEAALSHPEAVLIYHRVQPVSANLLPIHRVLPTRLLQGDVSDRVRKAAGWWACAPTSGLCLTRSVLNRLGQLPEAELRVAADGFLLYVVPLLGPVVGLKEPLSLYRRHGGNDTSAVAFKERITDRGAMASYLGRYERVLAAANVRLEALGVGARLDLEDNWAYQYQRRRTGLPCHLSRVRLAWRALRFPGMPAVTIRLKMAARAMVSNTLRGTD
jgi:glycosyltransferase involved in cell wall biosynthesis